MLAADADRIRLVPHLLARHRRRERMVRERPPAGLLVLLEEREVDNPVEDVLCDVDQPELAADVQAQEAEHPRHHRLVAGGEEHRRPGLVAECLQLALGEELRDRRADLPALVAHEVGEPLRAPLPRELFEARELSAGECLRRNDVPNGGGAPEHAELRIARDVVGVLDLHPEAEVRLVRAVLRDRLVISETRERPRRRRAPDGLERGNDRGLHHVEHVLAVDECHLEVELTELELPVGSQVFVPPARRDLVVAVDPADHEELLVELRRLRQHEEAARLQTNRDEEIACALWRPPCKARRPYVDETLLLHRTPDRGDDRSGQAKVPLHPVASKVEVAIPKSDQLLDALLVELERQRVAPREDLELRDLELDLACRQTRVDSVRSATHELSLGPEHELVADDVRGLGSAGRVLGVDHELADAGVVAQVDEDETAVVAPARGPAGERHPATDMLRPRLAAHQVAPAHCPNVSTSDARGSVRSSSPLSRTVASRPSRMTT